MRWIERARRAGRQDDEGAILPMTAVIVVVVMSFAAFAVDLGLARAARADMQALSDMVALDLVRHIDGRTASQLATAPDWAAAKKGSVSRNGSTIGSDPRVTVVLGRIGNAGEFEVVSGQNVPTAVKVVSATTVSHSFVTGEASPARSAVASLADDVACFSVTSALATVDTSTSPLVRALKSFLGVDLVKLDADVVGSAGIVDLADASIPLAGLAAAMDVGSPNELVALDTVRVHDFLVASADVLAPDHAAAAQLLRALAVTVPVATFDVADILTLGPGTDAASGLTVDAFDLITAVVYIAAKERGAIYAPATTVTVPGVADLAVTARVIQPPQIACGRAGEAVARSTQVDVGLQGDVSSNRLRKIEGEFENVPDHHLVNLVKSVLGLVGNLLNSVTDTFMTLTAELDTRLLVARAEGTLTSLVCQEPATGAPSITVDARWSSISTSVSLDATMHITLMRLLGRTEADVFPRLSVAGAVLPQTGTFVLPFPPDPSGAMPSQTRSSTVSKLGLPPLTPNHVTGITPSDGVLGQFVSSVTPVIGAVDDTVLALVRSALVQAGIGIGQVTVAATSRPACGSARLVG